MTMTDLGWMVLLDTSDDDYGLFEIVDMARGFDGTASRFALVNEARSLVEALVRQDFLRLFRRPYSGGASVEIRADEIERVLADSKSWEVPEPKGEVVVVFATELGQDFCRTEYRPPSPR